MRIFLTLIDFFSSARYAQATMSSIAVLTVNTIKTLTIDAIQKAESGHPGLPMGCADFCYVLWTKFLQINPANPHWHNRDRFVLSAGHGSMLLYSLLHLTGFKKMTMEQLKSFRQLHSLTPGHPEQFITEEVEATTGPLGQGTGNSVGMAIAQKFFAATFNTEEFTISNHRIYAIVSDGDLQEGVSHEAASLAGHLGLDNLVWFYDDNEVSIEGKTDLTYSDDVESRFKGYHWHVIHVDGHNHEQIEIALNEANSVKGKPTIIIGKTIIGKGSPKLQGTPKAHSDAFGEEEVKATKRNLGMPEDKHFFIPEEVKTFFTELRPLWQKAEDDWNITFQNYSVKHPDKAKLWQQFLKRQIPQNLAALIPAFPSDKPQATRNASGEILKVLMSKIPNLLGGSADLAPSTKTWIKEAGSFQKNTPQGRTLHFGIREHGMGSICNGLAYYGGLIPFGSTFLTFTDYMRPSIRLAALSQLQSIYIMTHDSIFLGEDGPTHQPVEHIASLRAIPNLCVIRPADANETTYAWLMALENKNKPTLLALTRQNVPVLDRALCAPASELRKGAYVLWESHPREIPDLILMGTGSETHLCFEAAQILSKENQKVRVVSMPSWDLFEAQPETYRHSVLPPQVNRRLAVEAGVSLGWERYVGTLGKTITQNSFGASAPYQILEKEFGFTVENVVKTAKSL